MRGSRQDCGRTRLTPLHTGHEYFAWGVSIGTQARRHTLRRRLRLQPPHGGDEEATVDTLSSHRKIIDGLIEQHHGRFVNSAGDSVLAEFASVVNAVQCAVDTQTALNAENANLSSDRRMNFRIGVNLGDVMVDGDQIYGDGVNVAARLENLADPGGICVSRTVHENIRNKLPLAFEDLGEQSVKNIAEPGARLSRPARGAMPARGMTQRVPRKYWRGGVFSSRGWRLSS